MERCIVGLLLCLCAPHSLRCVNSLGGLDVAHPRPRSLWPDGQNNSLNVTVSQQVGRFNTTYSRSIYYGLQYMFIFKYDEEKDTIKAARIEVEARNASEDFPVLFVVQQQRHVLSWQVPLLLEKSYDFYHVARTICPLETDHKTHGPDHQQIIVEVSSASISPINFQLKSYWVEHFELSMEMWHEVNVTPSEPRYFQYTFKKDQTQVVVRVHSPDDFCMVVSVQDVECPVSDMVRNMEFTGEYQTVTKQGAITVLKEKFKSGAFFVVTVVKPHDFDCSGVESIIPPPRPGYQRMKSVGIYIEGIITKGQYLGAVLAAVAWILVFYVVALIISLIYYFSESPADLYQEPVSGSEGRSAVASIVVRTPSLGSNPQTPIIGGDGHPTGNYGATAGSSSGGMMETDMRTGTFSKTTNGFPHRIPPPTEDSDSEGLPDEYDMLQDAEQEKDIFRTKTFLYVADLARKDRKVLKKKYKLYYWNLLTIAIFYGLPVIQLVITYQKVLHMTGDEDICYYNFLCSHPLGVLSSFNNVFSNIGYVMLGLLFLVLVFRRDFMYRRQVRVNERLEKYYGIPQHFGVFYAMGVALMMEGILSGCYHVCPSYSNFQFDTSFMYMIGWLCMLKIYQTRHPDINAQAHIAYFAIAGVICLAVIGVVYADLTFWIIFTICHATITILLTAQIYYMGRWHLDLGLFQRIYLFLRSDFLRCSRPLYPDRMILLVIANLINWSIALYGVILQPQDFASYILAIFIVNLLMYYAFYIIMKLRSGERLQLVALVFIILAAIVWGFAFYFFISRLTSWQETAAQSRVRNKKCLLLGFYDEHDIWHFLSATALFCSFMTLLTLDDDLTHTPRDRIPVF